MKVNVSENLNKTAAGLYAKRATSTKNTVDAKRIEK